MEVATILGVPFVRLAAFVPAYMLAAQSLQAATGRAEGLAAAPAHPSDSASSPKIDVLLTDDSEARLKQIEVPSPRTATGSADINELASTALVHAIMLSYCYGSNEDIAEQQALYLLRAAAAGLPPAQYWRCFIVFKEMLTSGVLGNKRNWWTMARLLRSALLVDAEGVFWDASDDVAVILLARSPGPRHPPPRGVRRLASALQTAAAAAAAVFLGSSGSDAAGAAYEERRSRHLGPAAAEAPAEASAEQEEKDDKADQHLQCPLAYSQKAIAATLPLELRAACGDAALRVWTTALVVQALSRLTVGWCPGADTDGSLVEQGRDWVNAQLIQAKAHALPQLGERVWEASASAVAGWQETHEACISTVRGSRVVTPAHARSMALRSLGELCDAVLRGHSTVSIFSAIALVGTRCWQVFYLAVSALMACLTSSIALYYSHASTCCAATRVALGCDPSHALPCRGWEGNCDSLASFYYQFSAAALAAEAMSPAPALSCTAFPDPDSSRDTFLVGLISAAVAFPIVAITANCFGSALVTDQEHLHGRMRVRRWPLPYALLLGAAPWQTGRPASRWDACKLRLAGTWARSSAQAALVGCVDAGAWAWHCVRRILGMMPPPAPPSDEGARLAGEAITFSRVTTAYLRGGLVVLYLFWGFTTWIVLVYGRLLYRLLDEASADAFITSWGISIGLSQVSEFQALAVSMLQALLVLTVLETLWLLSNAQWLENTLDMVSVQASVWTDRRARGAAKRSILSPALSSGRTALLAHTYS